jgi:hypothetical protein
VRCGRALVVVLACGVVGCSSQSSSEVRAAEVYDTAIRWMASERADDPEPLRVFVEPRGEGASIGLDVQAEVIKLSADVADVRFIDVRDEALVETDSTVATSDPNAVEPVVVMRTVRDDGMLIRLGPVIEDGARLNLDIDRWVADEQFTTLEFVLRDSGGQWQVVGSPVVTGSLDLEDDP